MHSGNNEGLWEIQSPGIKPGAPAMGAQRLNHWTTREVPPVPFLPRISSATLGESFSFSSSVTWRV